MRHLIFLIVMVMLVGCTTAPPPPVKKTVVLATNGAACKSIVPTILTAYTDYRGTVRTEWTGACKNGELNGNGVLKGYRQDNQQLLFSLEGYASEDIVLPNKRYGSTEVTFYKFKLDWLGHQISASNLTDDRGFVVYGVRAGDAMSQIIFDGRGYDSGEVTIYNGLSVITEGKYYIGSWEGYDEARDKDEKGKRFIFRRNLFSSLGYKIWDMNKRTILEVKNRDTLDSKYKTRRMGNAETGEYIPQGILTQDGQFIACYADSTKYTSQAECDRRLNTIDADYKAKQEERIRLQELERQRDSEEQSRRLSQVLAVYSNILAQPYQQQINNTAQQRTEQASTRETVMPMSVSVGSTSSASQARHYTNQESTYNKCVSNRGNQITNVCNIAMDISACVISPEQTKNFFDGSSAFECPNGGLFTLGPSQSDGNLIHGVVSFFACPSSERGTSRTEFYRRSEDGKHGYHLGNCSGGSNWDVGGTLIFR